MNIKPEDKSIKDLLNCGAIYTIPRYQREYSWDKENYREFLEDMINSLKVSSGKISANEYFMGTMLFIGELRSGQEVYVVDGQQRLTTITILFSAISDRFKEKGEEKLSELIFKYIMNTNDDGEQIRTLNTKSNYPYFAFYIQDRNKLNSILAKSEEEEIIFSSYNYLFDNIGETKLRKKLELKWGKSIIDTLNYIDILKALRDQILKTIVVSICTDNKTNANRVFEILNAKGKRLANIDLIKNKLFEVLDTVSPADYAEETWKEIKSILCSGKENIGFATFYSHFWVSKYKKTYTNKLYDDFNQGKILPKTVESYKAFLESMKENANWYVQIVSPTREYWSNRKQYFPAVQYLNNLSNIFSIVQSRIALLALFDVKERGLIDQSAFVNTISKLERFHYLYNSICSKRTSRLEKVYSEFALKIRKTTNKSEAKACIEKLYSDLKKLYPTYEEFEPEFIKLTFSKKDNPDNLKVKYAVYMLCSHAEGQDNYLFPESGSIEHILPECSGPDALNIGNLIALEQKINQDCDSKDYCDKINDYKKSKYNCVIDFVRKHKKWEAQNISERAKEMANTMYYDILTK